MESTIKKVGVVIGIIILIFVIIFVIEFLKINGFTSSKGKKIDDAIGKIQTEFSDEYKLETQSTEVKLPYSDSDYKKVFEKYNIPFTRQDLSFEYSITIRAGIKDLREAKIEKNENKICMTLPNTEILNEDNDIGEISEPNQSNNPLNQVQAGDIEVLKKELKQKAIDKSIEEGILIRAKNQAEEQIKAKVIEIVGEDFEIEINWE